jgi:acylphosphatase
MRLRVRYAGRVQGVGFRATARSIMSRHPVTGWVRNEPDETVLLEVQGEDTVVRAALDDLRASMGQNIQSEDALCVDAIAGERRFEITH